MTEFEKWLNKKIILLDNIGLDIDGYSLAELKAYQKVLAKYQELVDKETPKEGIKIGDRGGGRMTKEEYYKTKFTKVQKKVLELLEIEDKCLAHQTEQLFIKYIIDVENACKKIKQALGVVEC